MFGGKNYWNSKRLCNLLFLLVLRTLNVVLRVSLWRLLLQLLQKKSKNSAASAGSNDVHDSRDEEIIQLKLQVQLMSDTLNKFTASQTAVPGLQQCSNNSFVPPNTNAFQQMFATQPTQQQPQRPLYGAAGNYSSFNDEDAFCSFLFKQQQSNQVQLQLDNFF